MTTEARRTIALLYRRAGFGLAPGELDALEALGVAAVIDRLVDPGAHGIAGDPVDPWADAVFPLADTTRGAIVAVDRWLDHLLVTSRPFEEWMAWYWHGHLVSSVAVVAFTPAMVDQVNLFRRLGLGRFADLLRAVTIDPAMLRYLDGDESSGTAPNENYAREMLELFALGIGQYTEADVQAGARALTGWRVRLDQVGPEVDPFRTTAWFDPSAHDDTPQRYLDREGVHDLDTVIAAVVDHEACPRFVATRLGRAILGPDADRDLLWDVGDRFRAADLDLRTLARDLLVALAEGHGSPIVQGPLPWLLAAQRATGARLAVDDRYWRLSDAGHLPLWPPNVGGWPGGATWLSSSVTAQRYNLAAALADATPPDNPARQAAAAGDLEDLADALGRPEGFSPTTADALETLVDRDDGTALLAVALASPDLVVA